MAAVDGRNIHQVQDDRAQTDSFGPYLSAFRFNLPCRLAYAPQDVECKRRKREDERIGPVVVRAWKSLDIHIRSSSCLALRLTMKSRPLPSRDARISSSNAKPVAGVSSARLCHRKMSCRESSAQLRPLQLKSLNRSGWQQTCGILRRCQIWQMTATCRESAWRGKSRRCY